jgi:hypothetical protein
LQHLAGAEAGERFDTKVAPFHDSEMVRVKTEAAEAVPAFVLRPVRIEHPHSEVGVIGRQRDENAIRAHAFAPVAELGREGGPIVFDAFYSVHNDEVVAGALHFVEWNGHVFALTQREQ